ncbi:hypothetical protein TFKS16_0988 [Tannerella forsythia KS16]|nr:hypothetical protein TF3313_1112 [Tannerella forsythia 3313]BAR51270.1 hypothetical protein TFKS16_0988 [Tannerella forsythia KS16]
MDQGTEVKRACRRRTNRLLQAPF